MAKVVWTKFAFLDLQEIFDFISKDSKRYAQIQVLRIKEKTNILKANPFVGRMVPEFQKENIRELIEGNYRIIYRIKSDARIDIITVHHSARLLDIDKI